MRCLSCTKWIPQICERCRKPEVYDSEIDRLRTRIADLEEAGRKLGALCWAWQAVPKHKLNYLLFQPSMSGACAVPEGERIRQARFEVDSHPTAAGFVKEPT